MESRFSRSTLLCAAAVLLGMAVVLAAAPLSAAPLQDTAPQRGEGPRGEGPEGAQRMPVFGRITKLGAGSIEIENVNGETVAIKLTDKTEFRKDRQPAKRTDFKVGDIILVRGDENADHSWTAQVIAARSLNGPGGRGFGGPGGPDGRGGPGGGRGEFQQQAGTLGKDYVAGEIKSIDAPKLAVLRTDNVAQTLELNEDTSLRKGRDAITMADIQPGDHVFARGGLENNVFVPKTVVIIGAEQWKRMQEWNSQAGGQRRGNPNAGGGAGAAAGSAASPPTGAAAGSSGSDGQGGQGGQKPPEPQH